MIFELNKGGFAVLKGKNKERYFGDKNYMENVVFKMTKAKPKGIKYENKLRMREKFINEKKLKILGLFYNTTYACYYGVCKLDYYFFITI